MKDTRDERRGYSRRDFLKGTSATAAVATLSFEVARPSEAHADEAGLGPSAVPIQLKVNGKEVQATVEPRVTLLDCLRDYIDVMGCKRVCDRGTCGACTVLLDGKAIYACSMLAVEAVGADITTCEGLADGESLHPVQQAFWDKDASQCGFCTPGFVVACAAVLKRNPKASPDEIRHGLDGNLCRCGTYEQMAQAIEVLAKGNG